MMLSMGCWRRWMDCRGRRHRNSFCTGVAVGGEVVGVSVALVAKIQASQVAGQKTERDAGDVPARGNSSWITRRRKRICGQQHHLNVSPNWLQALPGWSSSRDKMDLILRIGSRNPAREQALPRFMNIFIDLAAGGTVVAAAASTRTVGRPGRSGDHGPG